MNEKQKSGVTMRQEQKDLLREVYEKYQGPLRATAFNQNIPEHEVDDMIQETFFRFFKAYGDRYSEWNEAQKKSVLMRILKNLCIDYFRELKRRREVSIDDPESGIEYDLLRSCVQRSVCHHLIEEEEILKIHECILAMKPAWRDMALLHLVEGRPLAEVCEILKISEAAGRMRVSRIKKYLKQEFKKLNIL